MASTGTAELLRRPAGRSVSGCAQRYAGIEMEAAGGSCTSTPLCPFTWMAACGPPLTSRRRRRYQCGNEELGLVRGLPREINHPVFAPSFAPISGAVTLPVGGALGDPGPGDPRAHVGPCLLVPLAVKFDFAAFKPSAPDQDATRRR